MYKVIAFILGIIQVSVGEFSVDVNLVRYYRQPDRCCDRVLFVCNDCDVYMNVCLYPSGLSSPACQGGNDTYRVDNTHGFLFNDQPNVKDHSDFKWHNLKGKQLNVTLEIVVYDHESLESDTTLGILQYNYIGPKVQNKSITTLPGRKQLEVEFLLSVTCSLHYYGQSCTKTCVPHGNLTCDVNGNLRCRLNYCGPDCCQDCVAGASYTCGSNGTKICKQPFYGHNCTSQCTAQGNLTCDSNGQHVCRPDHCGPDCCRGCIAHDNILCHNNGTLMCSSNNYGANCIPLTTTSNCADLHDSCAEFDLVYGICKATPHDSPLLYKQALEECKRTCRFC